MAVLWSNKTMAILLSPLQLLCLYSMNHSISVSHGTDVANSPATSHTLKWRITPLPLQSLRCLSCLPWPINQREGVGRGVHWRRVKLQPHRLCLLYSLFQPRVSWPEDPPLKLMKCGDPISASDTPSVVSQGIDPSSSPTSGGWSMAPR